ncbi:MAG: DMT family transporter [Velocimicrobium sp.]
MLKKIKSQKSYLSNDTAFLGHLTALFSILVWGTTFISTKVLLTSFSPIEVLFIRFIIAYFVLWGLFPHPLLVKVRSQEWYFAAAGLCGVTLYFLFENIALTYTLASKVGVIVAISPFFTAIISWLFLHNERPHIPFFIGFFLAMTGIALVSFDHMTTLSFNPLGDILAILAAFIWAVYSSITKKIGTFGYPTVPMTRRIFFYGLVFMIPALFIMDFSVTLSQFTNWTNLLNLCFLGICASALCFVSWNFAVNRLGSIKTSVYIYLVPVIAALSSVLILHETFTVTSIFGICLTLLGLFLSERKNFKTI